MNSFFCQDTKLILRSKKKKKHWSGIPILRTLRLFKVVFLTLAEICPRFFENYHHLETFKQSQVPSERNHNYSWPDLSRNFMINTVSFLFWSYQKSCNDHYVCLMKGISSVRLAITFFWILPIFFFTFNNSIVRFDNINVDY